MARIEYDLKRLLVSADFDSAEVRRLLHHRIVEPPLVAKPSKVGLAVRVEA